jgi:hypothetical protein
LSKRKPVVLRKPDTTPRIEAEIADYLKRHGRILHAGGDLVTVTEGTGEYPFVPAGTYRVKK